MPNLPSIKTLESHWPGKGKVLRGLLDGSVSPDGFESVRNWERQCFHPPCDTEKVLEALNEVLEGYGTEAMHSEDMWVNSYWRETAFAYVNQGDTYTATICYIPDEERFVVSCWGDLMESFERKGVKFK